MPILPAGTAIVLALSVVLGGATRQGYVGDVIVQMAACFLIGLTLWVLCEPGRQPHPSRLGKVFLGLIALLCLVQLLPVFPGLGVKTLSIPEAAGGTLTVSASWWSRISLTPSASWAGLTSALVPVAVFMAVTQCDGAGRVLLWRVVLLMGGIALLLGILQVLQGATSPLRFFTITNPNASVGFFANRNHFAGQLYVTLAFIGAWLATAGQHLLQQRDFRGRGALLAGGSVAALLLLMAGLAMTNSRAGMVIAMLVVLGIGAMIMRAARQENARGTKRVTRGLLLLLGLVVLLVVLLGLQQIVSRFQTDVVDDLRWPLNRSTFGAALQALPFGTGIGSFVRVYGALENPAHLTSEYANRAHDDLAEFLLETGFLGAALIVLFLVWFGRHALRAWSIQPVGRDAFQIALQQAATLAIAAMLLHALVDYGLRTTALSTLFALACGLLTRPVPAQQRRDTPARDKTPTASRPSRMAADIQPPAPATQDRPTWEEEIAWPDAWKPGDETQPGRPGGARQG